MEIDEIIRALCGAKQRFKDDGEVYKVSFFQQEFEAYEEALKILISLRNENLKSQNP